MSTTDIRNGPIGPVLVRLSLPVLIGQAFNLLYSLVDTWFIARIDTADPWLVGSTGLVFPLFFIFLASSFGISGGVSSLVSRAIGAGKTDELDRTAESGIFLALAASVIILGLMYPFATPLLTLFGGQGKLLEYGLSYLLWLLPTVPFMLLSAVFTGILQGEGRTRYMMTAMMIGTVANIILDPIFIFVLKMGVAGAGLATAVGNAMSFIYLVTVFLAPGSSVKIHWKASNVSFPVVGEILRVGLPQSVLNFLSSISFIFYNRIMTDINPMILTAFTLYSRLEQIALIPIWSLSSALSSLAGQAAGAGDIPRMKKAAAVSSGMGLAVTGSLLLAFVLSSSRLYAVFQSDPGILSLAGQITVWMAAASFASVPIFMINTILSSSGFAGWSLGLTIVRIYVFNVPACFIGAYVVGRNLSSVMIAIFISSVVSLGFTFLAGGRFFNGLASGRLKIRLSAQQ